MKRIISILLVLCLLIGLLPGSALAADVVATGKCGINATWQLDSDGVLLIYGSGDIDNNHSVDKPAWKNYKNLIKKVEILEGITSIGKESFTHCTSLEQVILPESLISIGESAFYYCQLLTELVLPSKIESLGDYAFMETGILSITIPEKVTTVSQSLFYGCFNLTSVTFQGPITMIYESAFSCCKLLQTVVFEQGLSGEIKDSAFAYCESLSDIEIHEGVNYIHDNAFVGCKSLTEITLPESLRWLGSSAFRETGLISVTIPKNVESIGDRPFDFCYNLKNITVYSESVEGLRGWLDGEEALEYIHIIGNAPQSEEAKISSRNENFVIYYDAGTSGWVSPSWKGWLIRPWNQPDTPITGTCGENLTWSLKDGVLTISGIGNMTHYSYPDELASWNVCRKMISQVVINDGVASIGNHAFYNLPELTAISIPGSVKSIGSFAFESCTSLKEIIIPDGVESVDVMAFLNCTALTTVTMADSVTDIGWDLFSGCTNLTSATLSENLTKLTSGLFYGCTKLASVNIPAKCTEIGSEVFYGCSALTGISIPNGVTVINAAAFSESGLTEVTIPASVTALMGAVFSECTSLQRVYFVGDAPEINDYVFQNVTATCTYPSGNDTWTDEVKQNYDGTIIWIASDHVHDNQSVYVEASCTEQGYRGEQCSLCGHLTVEEYINLKDHANDAVYVAPTCTETGYHGQVCSVCAHVSVAEYVNPLGHDMADATCVVPKTCRRQGCGYCEGTVANHSWQDPCMNVRTCIICGHTDTAGGHDWDDASSETHYCYACGAVEGGYLLDLSWLSEEAFVDGAACPTGYHLGFRYALLKNSDAKTLVTYTFANTNYQDQHMRYPTGMKVWLLTLEGNRYKATYVAELDNILQYAGSSIRITGTKGIRMITSIEKAKKAALTGAGLAGYTLVEYGTALCWAKDLEEGNPMTLGNDYVKSNYAYKRGVADPIFAQTDTVVQYTNVLVGFNLDQCKDDIAMRPYIILEDASGTQITIYGGIVYRSIGYIAYQNRNAFQAGTSSYHYVWEIIQHVYGSTYNPEFKG